MIIVLFYLFPLSSLKILFSTFVFLGFFISLLILNFCVHLTCFVFILLLEHFSLKLFLFDFIFVLLLLVSSSGNTILCCQATTPKSLTKKSRSLSFICEEPGTIK